MRARHRITVGRELRIALCVAVAAFAPASGRANEPLAGSGGCECEDEQYDVYIWTAGTGTVTISPEKPLYRKGEWVAVSYTLGENEQFMQWECDPPSNTASYCPAATTIFRVADHTVVTAEAYPPGIIDVKWNPQLGDVPLSGEVIEDTPTRKIVRVVGEPFTELNLTADANEGYWICWDSGDSSLYEDSATVPFISGMQMVECRFRANDDTPDIQGTFTAQVMGGGEEAGGHIRMGDDADLLVPPVYHPRFLTNSIEAGGYVNLHCWTEPGFSFVEWCWEGGDDDEEWTYYYAAGPARSFTAEVVPWVFLNLVTEGQGVITGDNLRVGYNPNDCTLLPLHAEVCNGWGFDRWEMDNGQGEWTEVEMPPPLPSNWPYYTVIMDETRTVKAVFWEACDCDGPDGRDTVRDMYENPEVLDYEGHQYTPKPGCTDLVTDTTGHAQEYEDPGDFTFEQLSCNHDTLPGAHDHWQLDDGVSDLVQYTSDAYEQAINIMCAFRCPVKNNSLTNPRSRASSPHPKGTAFDWDQGGSSASGANWDVAIAAEHQEGTEGGATASRIFLYCGNAMMSLSALRAAECDRDHLPEGWTEYAHGHADVQQ